MSAINIAALAIGSTWLPLGSRGSREERQERRSVSSSSFGARKAPKPPLSGADLGRKLPSPCLRMHMGLVFRDVWRWLAEGGSVHEKGNGRSVPG